MQVDKQKREPQREMFFSRGDRARSVCFGSVQSPLGIVLKRVVTRGRWRSARPESMSAGARSMPNVNCGLAAGNLDTRCARKYRVKKCLPRGLGCQFFLHRGNKLGLLHIVEF